ncbi:uncharacterized protein LOC126748351 [Anthonomus grandis grandis]|uniref:uncharacterized protein LOC126748351 n=1 Tax=Anthonomus grandis grandis TaxID=2921223 RepID=UPI0021659BA8|nr:uncharacterized protein LOC126748351 [Anthonomus grandis grandis]
MGMTVAMEEGMVEDMGEVTVEDMVEDMEEVMEEATLPHHHLPHQYTTMEADSVVVALKHKRKHKLKLKLVEVAMVVPERRRNHRLSRNQPLLVLDHFQPQYLSHRHKLVPMQVGEAEMLYIIKL